MKGLDVSRVGINIKNSDKIYMCRASPVRERLLTIILGNILRVNRE